MKQKRKGLNQKLNKKINVGLYKDFKQIIKTSLNKLKTGSHYSLSTSILVKINALMGALMGEK